MSTHKQLIVVKNNMTMYLDYNPNRHLKLFAYKLRHSTDITFIDFNENRITGKSFATIMKGLSYNSKVHGLAINHGCIKTEEELKYLAHYIKYITLDMLYIFGYGHNKKATLDTHILYRSFRYNRTLTKFYTWGKSFTDIEIKYFLFNLRINNSLTDISLLNGDLSKISNRVWRYFGDYIRSYCTLKQLNLSNTSISDRGLIYLSYGLKTNLSIEILKLNSNNINGKRLLHLVKGLKHNKSIKSLFLNSNWLKHNDLYYITELINSNKTLRELYLTSTHIFSDHGFPHISYNHLEHFTNSVKTNRTLRKLIFDRSCGAYNNKSPFIGYICDIIKTNRTLIQFTFPFNYTDIQYILKALKCNTVLEKLSNYMSYLYPEISALCRRNYKMNRKLKSLLVQAVTKINEYNLIEQAKKDIPRNIYTHLFDKN